MTNDMAIEFKNVYEKYDIDILIDGKSTRESFMALKDISFSVRKGEAVAVIGPNGAGKSTTLRLIAGLLMPEKGEIRIHGRVGSLLDLGAGFHPELTGRDNLLLNASLYNFSREELNSKYDQILAFADIGKFINAPVRCYSQGMYVRLAFSLAIHVDPDILLIDDCLAVGDDAFRAKSLDKALEFKAKGKTIIFVTHDFTLARHMCERGIYIREGKIITDAIIDAAVASYVRPLEVDKEHYKYLGSRILEKERLQEEEGRRRLEEAKCREEEAKREAERLEEEAKRREKAAQRDARHHLEKERIMQQGCVLSRDPFLKFVIHPARIRIFYQTHELTVHYGVRTRFTVGENSFDSSYATWKIQKISQNEIFCFLRWRKPGTFSQIWHFKLLNDEMVNLEIMTRSRTSAMAENELLECCLNIPCKIEDEDRCGNKSRVFSCDSEASVRIETLQEDQICGISMERRELSSPYFLTVPERSSLPKATKRRVYFKGRFSSGQKSVVPGGAVIATHQLIAGRTKIDFREGSCQLVWDEKPLTVGLGIYTSLYSKGIWYDSTQTRWSKGIWYDSTQARWKIRESSPERFVAEGFWPWIPVSQSWEVFLKEESTISLKVRMKVFKETPFNMQETVMMLSPKYERWSAGKEFKEFPEGFTSDDFFRFCLWAKKADGDSKLSVHSGYLPVVTFKPDPMPGYRVIVENSAHIYDVKARLFHCLLVNKNGEIYLKPGEYEFFKGLINIKEEKI